MAKDEQIALFWAISFGLDFLGIGLVFGIVFRKEIWGWFKRKVSK